MNKASLRFCTLIAIAVIALFSCKKTNSLHQLPANNRLLNVTSTWNTTSVLGVSSTPVNENYRFAYDALNRITKLYYTTNDITKNNTISTFTYSGDTIFDRIALVNDALVEEDTFITDLNGHIATTFIQGQSTHYSYFGNLLTRVDYPDGSYMIMNSYNGNFITGRSSLGDGYNSTYSYYTDQVNRIGDYLYLTSMFRYGYNLYQNHNLIRTMVAPGSTVNASYVIDADSKITQTTAIVSDTSNASVTYVFDIQYEKY